MVSFHQGTIWTIHMEQKLIILQRSKNKQNRCTCKIKSTPTPEYLRCTGEVSPKTQNWHQVTFPRGLLESQDEIVSDLTRQRWEGHAFPRWGLSHRTRTRHGLPGQGQEAWVEIPTPPARLPDESTRNAEVLKLGFLKGNIEVVLPTS